MMVVMIRIEIPVMRRGFRVPLYMFSRPNREEGKASAAAVTTTGSGE